MYTALRAVVEPHMMYCAAVWAPVPADGGGKRWGVAASVANDAAVAFAVLISFISKQTREINIGFVHSLFAVITLYFLITF